MQLGQRLKHSMSMGNKQHFSSGLGNKVNVGEVYKNKNTLIKSQPMNHSPLERR